MGTGYGAFGIRLILKNTSGLPKMFKNPGDHTSHVETIPASGDKTAVMVMLEGDTIGDQQWAARELCKKYNLLEEGLSTSFVEALAKGEPLVKEAYGPAPFEAQADRLVEVNWRALDRVDTITPEKTDVCAYGARAPEEEQAFRTEFAIMVQGTSTNPEFNEDAGVVIAVSEHWETKEISTRPIAPSVAKGFYGKHYETMPIVTMHPDGLVESIDLQDGTVINAEPPEAYKIA